MSKLEASKLPGSAGKRALHVRDSYLIITENMPKSGMRNGNVTHGHLGNLASPGDLEESASHHVLII